MSGILRKKIGYRGWSSRRSRHGRRAGAARLKMPPSRRCVPGRHVPVCQKEESVRRAFEAVYKRAEADKKFARLVAEKSERVLEAKRKSRALAARMAPVPTAENRRATNA